MVNSINSPQWRISELSWANFYYYHLPPTHPRSYPSFSASWALSPSDWSRSCSFCLFHPIWPFNLLLSYRIWLKRFNNSDVSLWPLLCFLSLLCHSFQQSGIYPSLSVLNHIIVPVRSPTTLFSFLLSVFLFLCVHLKSLYGGIWSCVGLLFIHPLIKTQVLYPFHHWGYCLTGNTDSKQEKSVLLFRSESWQKRERKQHKGGYEGISPCDIVNCCSVLLNNHYYLVAGVPYVLCMLKKTWWQWYSLVGQELKKHKCPLPQRFQKQTYLFFLFYLPHASWWKPKTPWFHSSAISWRRSRFVRSVEEEGQ